MSDIFHVRVWSTNHVCYVTLVILGRSISIWKTLGCICFSAIMETSKVVLQ